MKRIVLAGILTLCVAETALAGPHDVYGTYIPKGGDSHVEIADCGNGTPCGTVVWIDPAGLPVGATPETVKDAQGQPILGLVMLDGFEKKKANWSGGRIYDPGEGKTYGSKLKRLADGTLEVKGCIGPICQTQIWQPVAAPTLATSK